MKTNEQRISFITICRSKLALRLAPIFVAVVAVPITVTVLVGGDISRQQIVSTAKTMERSNIASVKDSAQRYQKLGQRALISSSQKISSICLKAIRDTSLQSENDQSASLANTGKEFSNVTQSSLNGAMRQSLAANKNLLASVGRQMSDLFSSSARYTQARIADRVQTAILDQINSQMADRASLMAESFDAYIQTYVNYLGLTSQMLNLYQNDPTAQKAVLDALVRRFPMMTEVSVLNSNGEETDVSSANRVVLPSEFANRSHAPYFRNAISDQNYIGVDSYPVDTSAPIIRIAVPIELYRGKPDGVLSAAISLDDLWDKIRNTRFGKNGFAYVSDANGMPYLPPRYFSGTVLEQSAAIKTFGWRLVVAEPTGEVMSPIQAFKVDISTKMQHALKKMHGDILTASSLASTRLLKSSSKLHVTTTHLLLMRTSQILDALNRKTEAQASNENSHLQSEIRSQIMLGQSKTVKEMVVAGNLASDETEMEIPMMTHSALSKADHKLTSNAMIILLLSCCLSCLIGILLAGTLVRPIVQLSQGTRSLAMGELDKRVDERAPAEIGDLAVAFNMMAASLQKSRADLTDAELQLVQSAKLASLGTLSAGVAHELNQPVAIIRGLAQQLKLQDALQSDIREDIEIIEGQTGRMMKIITHLRTFCRTGGSDQTPINVNQVVRDCFILLHAQLKSHGIEVQLNLSEEPLLALGDANELEQVFINLITNARDALHGQADGCIAISSTAYSGSVILRFRDNGGGIPDAVAPHIFDPFFTTKEVGKGTGLGLSISHGLIQKHHGTITASNDNGAVFTITIPLLCTDSVEGEETSARSMRAA